MFAVVIDAAAGVLAKEPPNPILPVTAEIVWTVIGFVLLVVLLRLTYPKVARTMDQREDRRRADLAEAEEAQAEADRLIAEYQARLAASRAEATRVLDETRRELDAVKAERVGVLNAELAGLRAEATAEIEASKNQALASLQASIADLSGDAAGRVLDKQVSRETAEQLVARYLGQSGGAR